jgi:hypothetical protein
MSNTRLHKTKLKKQRGSGDMLSMCSDVFIPGFLLGDRSVVVGPGVVEGGAEAGTEKETEQRDRLSVQ